MSDFTGSTSSHGVMYVRALYDYDADERTSLSFRQGDIIQVITQLESGWWDGVFHGVRGWFPSNYCSVISGAEHADSARDADLGHEWEEEYGEQEMSFRMRARDSNNGSRLHFGGEDSGREEEAAFWIPQATPDGRLFYFNTLTGVSSMELPLETPTSDHETGPRDRTNIRIPDQTRVPPVLSEYESPSETDDISGLAGSKEFLRQNRRSYVSNGLSPATSIDSLYDASPATRTRAGIADSTDPSFSVALQANPPNGTTMTSFSTNPLGPPRSAVSSRKYFEDAQTVVLTWNILVEDMRRAVQRYREAINNSDRAEFVRRAENISDQLRLLLAAGSGTTDNHSGDPSIISRNKALYPHFREMMLSFSKLVLSSHNAAADFTPTGSYSKCLQEAEGLLHGVYGFVEVARQQRGEEIPRLTPGFVSGSRTGGSWQNNGITLQESALGLPLILRDDLDPSVEPDAYLNGDLLERMEDLKNIISASIRRLDEHLALRETLITPKTHQKIGDNICVNASHVIDACRPYISAVEKINLASLGSSFQTPQLVDFGIQKQKFYDSSSDLIMACQTVSSPLGDEWSEVRGIPLDERLLLVRTAARDLESSASQLNFSAQILSEIMPRHLSQDSKAEHRRADGGSTYGGHVRPMVTDDDSKVLAEGGMSQAFSEGLGQAVVQRMSESSKVQKFFGEVPAPTMSSQADDVPDYLRLDHEGEIAYDTKTTPPQLRGGTLTGLVEQLTRHDRLDSPLNNTFLLTYRSFTTAAELFEMLVKRWSLQPPHGLSAADMQIWIDKKQKPIRFRVVNILKSWFDNYWMEGNDETSQQLMQRVYTFAKETVASTSTPGAGPLMTAIEQRMRGQDAPSKRLVLTLNTGSTPASIIPKNIKKLKFLDIDSLEFARQLTVIESRLYYKIKPTECLNKTWQKKLVDSEPEPAANIKALILHSNQLTNWVAQMILTQTDVKRRVIVIKHFVAIADKCRLLNNFSTLTSIISALGTAPIHRLSRTWGQVNQKTQATLELMRKVMGSTKNFLEYREALHKADPPCIPFFGVYLTDLTFIEDGIPSLIKKTNLINFAKRAKTADVIRDIQQYQNVPYPLHPVPELQDYILKNMQTAGDVHEMYERSLIVEPREREDEKIARLLSESGFL